MAPSEPPASPVYTEYSADKTGKIAIIVILKSLPPASFSQLRRGGRT